MAKSRSAQRDDVQTSNGITRPAFADASGIGRPTAIPTVPAAAWPAMCELLAKMAFDSAACGDREVASRVSGEATIMIESLAASDSSAFRTIAAEASLPLGDALLLLEDAAGAKACFKRAMRTFDHARDTHRAARARVGLAKSLLALEDPSALAVLEDAGELYEDLGDTQAVSAVEIQLRHVEARLTQSRRSFHAKS